MIRLSEIAYCIEEAAIAEPPLQIAEFCGKYYSPYYQVFWLLMAMHSRYETRVAVELGCDQGRGLVSLAHGGGMVYGVDHTRKPQMDQAQALYDNIVFLQTNSNPPPGEIPHDIFLLHIDTEHSYSQAQTEFEAYKSRLANPAVVVFDDLHAQEDSVMRYFMSLPYPKIQDDRMHPSCGWGVILYNE